jgi:broad specificity phosphatase PhoE
MNKSIIVLLLIFVLFVAIAFDQTYDDNENGDDYQCSIPTKIILVRHGQTDWNLRGILQGNADVPLDSTGVMEAQELAVSTSDKTIDAVYSSPLSRAYETAQTIATKHQLSVEEEDDLREIGVGIYTGYQGSQIPSDIRISWTTDPNFAMPSGVPDSNNLLDPSYVYGIYFEGESLNMVADRSWDEITDIAEEHCGENVVTVTHGGIIGITLTQVYGLPVTDYRNYSVETGSQTVLEFQPNSSVVVLDDW